MLCSSAIVSRGKNQRLYGFAAMRRSVVLRLDCSFCYCHFGSVAQQTFLQKWQAPSRQSQLLQRGVLCPWAQLSDGIHVAAMQSPSPESVSQKRPVTWPQSTQARSKSDSSPYANTSIPPSLTAPPMSHVTGGLSASSSPVAAASSSFSSSSSHVAAVAERAPPKYVFPS